LSIAVPLAVENGIVTATVFETSASYVPDVVIVAAAPFTTVTPETCQAFVASTPLRTAVSV